MSSQTEFILKGSTDVTVDVMLQQDNSGTNPGDPLTGLVFNSSGLACYYREGATGTVTQLTLATQTVGGAHSDGGFVELSASNMPGMYRLDLSDTIVSGTNDKATVVISGFADLAPHYINLVLTDFDLQTATQDVNVASMNANTVTASAIASAAIDADAIAADAIGSAELAAGAVTKIWNEVVETEGSYTAQQVQSIILSVLAGETNTGGTVFRTPNDAATRVSATVDGSNNRTAMTLTPSS
jgi:hypothetical protein